jgi:hypothetical protein
MSRTSLQKTNGDGFPKAAEVIEITGAHELEAMDRAALNILLSIGTGTGPPIGMQKGPPPEAA